MSLPSWELLSYIVTEVALLFAIAVFLFEQRKERERGGSHLAADIRRLYRLPRSGAGQPGLAPA